MMLFVIGTAKQDNGVDLVEAWPHQPLALWHNAKWHYGRVVLPITGNESQVRHPTSDLRLSLTGAVTVKPG